MDDVTFSSAVLRGADVTIKSDRLVPTFSGRSAGWSDYVDSLGAEWETTLGHIKVSQCEICHEVRPSFMTTIGRFDLEAIVAAKDAKHRAKTKTEEKSDGDPLFQSPAAHERALRRLRPCDGANACGRCRDPCSERV